MTRAQSAAQALDSDAQRDALGRTVEERMERYGTSSEYIARRQVNVLNSRFVKHDPTSSSERVRRYGIFATRPANRSTNA